jgi:DAK2 domain fusion protein YloV
VPDGDTGTNLALTLRAAADATRNLAAADLSAVAAAAAKGALKGARGNAGVIFSQILRGFARALLGQHCASPAQIAAALRVGSDAAYAAVPKPVEGTILTAARDAAAAAEQAAAAGANIAELFQRAERAAQAAVDRSPEQLAILKDAGVVDSGAEGYRVILQGFWSAFAGRDLADEPAAMSVHADLSALHDEGDQYGYCTEVLFEGSTLDAATLRARVAELGTSVLVVGDQALVKVHVHTLRPGSVLDLATEHGALIQVKVENIQRQRQELAKSSGLLSTQPKPRQAGTAIVAVVAGAGFRDLYASLGAVAVTSGEALNPSVEEVVLAVESASRDDVIVLPNDPNAVLACEAAAKLAGDRAVAIIKTRSLAHGVAAALALNPDASVEHNLAAVEHAADCCHVLALTRSARMATVDRVPIAEGQVFAMLDGRVTNAGASFGTVLDEALGELPDAVPEIVTIYVGAGGSMDEARNLGDIVTARLHVDVEIVAGGQPHHHYLIAVE